MRLLSLLLAGTTAFAPAAVAAPAPVRLPDVETLNDDLGKYAGRRIQVEGRVTEHIDRRSLVLAGGGLINDEIVVVGSAEDPTDLSTIPKNTKLAVTGTLILKPVTDVSKEGVWSLTPRIATGFRDVKAFLIADEINRRE